MKSNQRIAPRPIISASPNTIPPESEIHKAIKKNDNNLLKFLISSGQDIDAPCPQDGSTPLIFAIESNNYAAFKIICEAKAKIYTTDKLGNNSLHYAAANKNMKFFNDLIQIHSNNINIYSQEFSDPLYKTWTQQRFTQKNKSYIDALNQYQMTPSNIAAFYNNVDAIKNLLEIGADINTVDCFGNTPLHYLARYHDAVEFIKFLVEKGANIEARNEHGATPLFIAAEAQDSQNVELLIKLNANINASLNSNSELIPCYQGQHISLLLHCLLTNKLDTAKILLKNEAQIDTKTIQNLTPYLQEIICNKSLIVNLLKEYDVDVSNLRKPTTIFEIANTDQIPTPFDTTPKSLSSNSDYNVPNFVYNPAPSNSNTTKTQSLDTMKSAFSVRSFNHYTPSKSPSVFKVSNLETKTLGAPVPLKKTIGKKHPLVEHNISRKSIFENSEKIIASFKDNAISQPDLNIDHSTSNDGAEIEIVGDLQE